MEDETLFDEIPESLVEARRHFAQIPMGVLVAKISGNALKVYGALRMYARPGHATFPHMDTVCETFGIAESTFRRGLAELKEAGLVVITKKTYWNGLRRSNVYYFPDVSDDGQVDVTDRSNMSGSQDRSELDPTDRSNMSGSIKEVEKSVSREGSKGAARRLSPFPDGFTLTAAEVATIQGQFPHMDLMWEFQKFQDWAKSKDARYKDWAAAFRNWCRRADTYASSRAPGMANMQAGPGRLANGQRAQREAEQVAREFYESEGIPYP